jgi:hypothetical protein
MSSRIFSIFSVVLLVLGCPEHSSPSTDIRLALKRKCHSKTAVQLKECSPKASQSISKVFGSGDAELHSKLDADTLLKFAIHHRQNETQRKKYLCKSNACSQSSVTWQTDSIGLQKCDLSLLSHLLLQRQLQQ